MAITTANFANTKRWPIAAGRWGFRTTFTGPSSYTSGGEPLTNALCLAALGLTRVESVQCSPIAGNSFANDSSLSFDHNAVSGSSQGKLHIYDQTGTNTGTEVVATTNYGTFTALLSGFGS